MSYELSYKHEPDCLYVQTTGNRTVENLIALSKDFLAVCDEYGHSKVVLDVRGMIGTLDTLDAYKMGKKDIEELRRTGQLKLSIIDLRNSYAINLKSRLINTKISKLYAHETIKFNKDYLKLLQP